MTLVNVETGELLGCSPEEARRLTDEIKAGVENVWNLVKSAYGSRAWTALGYESWDAYCAAEFKGARISLPREDRQEVVGSLRDAGLSTRAIAAATGINRETVMKDLRQVVGNQPPAQVEEMGPPAEEPEPPTPVLGTDGKTYRPKPKAEALADAAEALGDDLLARRSRFSRALHTYYERIGPFDIGEVVDAYAVDPDGRRQISDFAVHLRKTATAIDAALSRNQRLRSVK